MIESCFSKGRGFWWVGKGRIAHQSPASPIQRRERERVYITLLVKSINKKATYKNKKNKKN
jgi:hypothetical protein